MNSVNHENTSDSDSAPVNESTIPISSVEQSKNNGTLDSQKQLQLEVHTNMETNMSQTSSSEEPAIASQSSSSAVLPSQDCCISISESAYARACPDRFVGLIQAKGIVHGILQPNEFNMRSSRNTVGRGLGDVTLNLTEFLSYAQRNNYDIVIPASRENRPVNTSLPRIGSGRGYMVLEQQHIPRDFSAAGTAYPSEFFGLNNIPSRNSVLAPNIYHTAEEIQPPAVDFNAPPPYEMPLKLPTYEEVQREKAMEGEILPPNIDSQNPEATSPRTLSFLAIDTDMGTNADPESKLLGTDFMFAIAFFLALLFNWIGFLLLMCFCHTVAARYGALSGFGLSLAKWTIIVKNSTDVPVHNAWLWWLITAFGLLICIRSLFQYINIKRGWRLMSSATQERLLFFY